MILYKATDRALQNSARPFFGFVSKSSVSEFSRAN